MERREFVDSHRLKSSTRPGGGANVLKLSVGRERNNESPVLLIIDSEGNSETTGIQLDQSRWWPQFGEGFRFLLPIEFWWRQFKESVLGLVCVDDIILNPSTKEAIKLPDHDDDFQEYIIGYFPIARRDMICYRLGFDAVSKTYKALVLFSYLNRNEIILIGGGGGGRRKEEDPPGELLLARVLTLGIDSTWRNVNVSIPYEWAKRDWPSLPIRIHTSLFVDNQMFFLISHDRLRHEISIKPRLLVFGLQDEKFRLLGPLPGDLTISVHVFEWNRRLAVISTETRTEDWCRDAWTLEDHENEKWIKRKIAFDTTKYNALTPILSSGDLLITEYVETIFPLKQATTADQHVWRWGSVGSRSN